MTNDFEKFLTELINKELQQIEMSFVAKIISFDASKMRAKIRPLLRAVTESEGVDEKTFLDAIDIENVPVEIIFAGGCYIRPDYVAGDIVKVSCYGSSTEPPIEEATRADILLNRFQLNYCTVTAAVKPENFSFPDSFTDESGLIIGKDDTFIVFESSKVRIEGDLDVEGDIYASGDIVSGITPASVSLRTHTHGTPVGPSGPPVPS